MAMFAQVSTPVLGIVENMSAYVCPHCGTRDAVFGQGGGGALAGRVGVPLLAEIPLVPAIREGGDAGRPVVVAEPAHPASQAFLALAERVIGLVDRDAAAAPAGVAS
jgi:ATP-binding protein involved in chromosome partitioning